ncbi:DDB1- and CUL4-associated factor 15-like [Pollicipes pollicipes]|uniref:DDB1- and CUL4-associated factor 15-like n=1 Tax=Pollicipes pollicipes TaxID=41117 RepID=UPI0018856858|nr:DDB1- and CUL4-associated factor 15-like [Pollicipes pollicipes]
MMKTSQSESLPSKLMHRQVQGHFPKRSKIPASLFTKFPGRLAFCLKDIVPSPSVLSNHIFLGFSKCGQFVISYTQSTEFDETSMIYMQFRYRLHWWIFVPHQKLRKAAEVTLFGEQTVESRLFLAVCYWPEEDHRVVVYGCSDRSEDSVQGSRCYLTITAVPSLDACLDCVRVAESYGEDELAESWDSCVRFSCLRHGATVHTSFELVPPFPVFLPRLSLRRRGAVVINTGNFLHVVTAQVAAPRPEPPPADDASCAGSDQLSLSSLEVDVAEEPGPANINADEYEFSEDGSETHRENFTVFRKKRLADKKYEFSDENSENVPRFFAARPSRVRPAVVPPPPAPGACCVHLRRRYVEVDDELVSVITDVEEDDLSRSTGYHYALPLEVHGSGYSQMHMVTHSKAEKLVLPCVLVSQLSLDVEQFCHEISQRLCAEAGKKYWFCNDYDVEVVEVNPDSGDVVAVAVVLVQAAVKMKGLSNATRRPLSSVHRYQYRASFTFSWNMETGQYSMLTSDRLTEVTDARDLQPAGGGPRWQPARLLATALRHPSPLPQTAYNTVRVMTNQPALTGTSLKTIVDPHNMLALLLAPQRAASEDR